MSQHTYRLDDAIVSPDEANDRHNLLQNIYADVGLSEFMAFSALESARSAWEEDLQHGDTFVEGTLVEAIECLKRFHAAWRATVTAQQCIDESAVQIKKGDFAAARKLLANAEAMRKGFDPKSIEHTLDALRSGPNKIRELINEAQESA